MSRIHLSSPTERIIAVFVLILFSALSFFLISAMRSDITALILTVIMCLLALLLVVLYTIAVFRAAAEFNNAAAFRTVGLLTNNYDLSSAAAVKTREVTAGPVVTRCLVFVDVSGNDIAVVSTLFTSKRGVMAEPCAHEIAGLLSIEFIPTLERWEYDRTAAKEKAREDNAQERRERKARFRAIKRRLLRSAAAEEVADEQVKPSDVPPEINYDALDDEK